MDNGNESKVEAVADYLYSSKTLKDIEDTYHVSRDEFRKWFDSYDVITEAGYKHGRTYSGVLDDKRDKFTWEHEYPIDLHSTEYDVVEKVVRELEDLKSGELSRLSNSSVIASYLGKGESIVSHHLRKHPSLHKQRKESIVGGRKHVAVPYHNTELFSWYLGVMAGDGSSTLGDSTRNYSVKLTVTSPEFRDKFAEAGQELFGLESKLDSQQISKINPNWKDTYSAIVNSIELVELLGDMRAHRWDKTMQNEHSWLLNYESNVWQFLTGYFDSEGSVSDPRVRRKDGSRLDRIRYAVAYQNPLQFTIDLLGRVGVESHVEKSSSKREGVAGVGITGVDNIQRFAKNVQSVVPEKDSRLQVYRDAVIEKGCDEETLKAYKDVMKLRNKTGFGARRLIKHPRLAILNLDLGLVHNWIYGNDPSRRQDSFVFAQI